MDQIDTLYERIQEGTGFMHEIHSMTLSLTSTNTHKGHVHEPHTEVVWIGGFANLECHVGVADASDTNPLFWYAAFTDVNGVKSCVRFCESMPAGKDLWRSTNIPAYICEALLAMHRALPNGCDPCVMCGSNIPRVERILFPLARLCKDCLHGVQEIPASACDAAACL